LYGEETGKLSRMALILNLIGMYINDS
jgi:hypothetical protein